MREDLRPQKTKTSPKFEHSLSDEQKAAKKLILESKIAIITGKAGTSKTFLAAQIALDLKLKGCIDEIFISRSSVSKEDIGFLPGDVNAKMEGFVAPVIENMENLRSNGKKEIAKLLELGEIKLVPIQFLRGRTALNSVFIIDEAQNLTPEQIYTFVTRLGKGSLMIFTGDIIQSDLKNPSSNGLKALIETSSKVDGMVHVEMKENYRDPIIVDFMKHYEKYLPENLKKAANVGI